MKGREQKEKTCEWRGEEAKGSGERKKRQGGEVKRGIKGMMSEGSLLENIQGSRQAVDKSAVVTRHHRAL